MSASGIHYQLNNYLGSNKKLAAYYDFGDISYAVDGAGPYTGIIFNSYPAFNQSLYEQYLLSITGSVLANVESQLSTLFSNDYLDLRQTNIRCYNSSLNLNDISILIDFEFPQTVHDGVIFGSFEKIVENIEGIDYTGSRGFNVGVTARGHLFLQTYGLNGDSINVLDDIELSKRNIIGISSYQNSIILSRFDYFNNLIQSAEINVDSDYIANTDYFYFGGSNEYFRSSSASDLTCSGIIYELAIFSGACSSSFLKNVSSGILGDYYYNGPTETVNERVTGYSENIVYKTGIIGYDYQVTGTLDIYIDREKFTGSYVTDSTESKQEGERYYKYYSFDNGDYKTFYKEELGFLHPDSGYIYYPTGSNAYDTLGLQNISDSITTYIETTGLLQDSVSINLYGKTPITGTLTEISGIISTALTEEYSVFSEAESGIYFTGDASKLKKDYIYYLGSRL